MPRRAKRISPECPTPGSVAAAFTQDVRSRFGTAGRKQPEEQLRAPLTTLLKGFGDLVGTRLTVVDNTPLDDNTAIPDMKLEERGLLLGHVEIKAPGTGVDVLAFTGHNRQQWERFTFLPNILYTDGNSFALYRSGELVGEVLHFVSNIKDPRSTEDGAANASQLETLFRNFVSWNPTPPATAKALADSLAPICRLLRAEVYEAVAHSAPAMLAVKQDWEDVLEQDASQDLFADHYAQTVTFALLLARAANHNATLTLSSAATSLGHQHAVLSKTLLLLTDATVESLISTSLGILLRLLNVVDVSALAATKSDFWLYFYEDFLEAYDPRLRQNAGVYYTPHQVVGCQINLVHDVLATAFAKPDGIASDDLVLLDPATGTGTYALGIVSKVTSLVTKTHGKGAIPAAATRLARHLYGFELLVGPYAVAQQRLAQAIRDAGGTLPAKGLNIFRANTLSDPYATPPALKPFFRPITEEQRRALALKQKTKVMVCIGNPPYEYHLGGDEPEANNWVRYGGGNKAFRPPLLDAFLHSKSGWSAGLHAKSLYNLYVYFWRWALWKVLEQTRHSKGIVCFISPRAFIDGPAYAGIREHLRRVCTKVWVIDLGGDSRLDASEANIFAIRTGVSICLAARTTSATDEDTPADVLVTKIAGKTTGKLDALAQVEKLADLTWSAAPTGWLEPFVSASSSTYRDWPALTDIFPWQEGGVQIKRTWPAYPSKKVLIRRWEKLVSSSNRERKKLFFETRDRKITKQVTDPAAGVRLKPVSKLTGSDPPPELKPYSYRSLDNQLVFYDPRLIDFSRHQLWRCQGPRQIFFGSKLTVPIGQGPALMACAHVPDFDFFNNRGARDIIPLYRDGRGATPNICPKLLEGLSAHYQARVTAHHFAAYAYGVLCPRNFLRHHGAEAATTRVIRLPVTDDFDLFRKFCRIGRRLVWLHTYGKRWNPGRGAAKAQLTGTARWTTPLTTMPTDSAYDSSTQTLRVGDGVVSHVDGEVWGYEISGFRVVPKWIGYRLRKRQGRRSSPLDLLTMSRWTSPMMKELVSLIWILEATVAIEKRYEPLYSRLLATPTIDCNAWLSETPDNLRNAPNSDGQKSLF